MPTFKKVNKKDLEILQNFGYYFDDVKTQYEITRMKGECTLILFNSNKLLIQGKDNKVKELVTLLKNEKVGEYVEPINFVKEEGVVIGTDEAMKGDTFGGLIVAGVKADDKTRENLLLIGVGDSKKIKDEDIQGMAKRIKEIVCHHIISLSANQYNILIEELGNVTKLLNRMHQQCIDKLDFHDLAVVDKYPGCNVGKAMTKAESKYIEVAAASILARDETLKQFRKMSKELKFTVPKGSTTVKEEVMKIPKDKLKKYVKLHFKNVQQLFPIYRH
tara:strand:- start:815 stop:1639 length:825 start_codon:yes stop_codon:yes gene_type:complete